MRIFIAAVLPDEIKRLLGEFIEAIKGNVQGVKWELPHKLHITLKFIGEVNSDFPDRINSALSNCDFTSRTIEMRIDSMAAFPNLKKPKVLVVKFDKSGILDEVHDCIEHQMSLLGIGKETREFIPHVTIGRVKSGFKIKGDIPSIDNREFKLRGIEIVRSLLNRHGSDYFTCFAYRLGIM